MKALLDIIAAFFKIGANACPGVIACRQVLIIPIIRSVSETDHIKGIRWQLFGSKLINIISSVL
jgi:hypothetical protein